MAVRIRKATAEDKAAYAATKPTYPLYGWLTLDGVTMPVEDLRGEWSKENPQYEARCPKGFHFEPQGTHAIFGLTLNNLLSRVGSERLVPCTEAC